MRKVYYKVRQVLQSATSLLQSETSITKCDKFNAKPVRGELQSATVHSPKLQTIKANHEQLAKCSQEHIRGNFSLGF